MGWPQAPTEAPQRPPPIGADVRTLEDGFENTMVIHDDWMIWGTPMT